MTDILFQIIQIILSMGEVWLCYQLLYNIFIDEKCLNKHEQILVKCNIVVVGLCLILNRNIVFFSYVMFITEVFLTVICVMWIIRKSLILISGVIILFYSLISLTNFFFLFISTIFINEMFLNDYYGVTFFQTPIYLFSSIIAFVFIQFLKKRTKVLKEYIHEYRYILFALGIFLSFVLRKYQIIRIQMISGELPNEAVKSGLSLLLFIILGCTFVSLLLKSLILQKENQILLTRDELLRQNYQGMMDSVEKNKQILHDIKHHLTVINLYESDGEYEKLHTYLQNLNDQFSSTDVIAWTGNKVLDFILNRKKIEAEKKAITFKVYSTALLKQPLNDGDICILFGNLLDNAIEACENMNKGAKWIDVKVEKRHHLFLIEISNSMSNLPLIEKDKFITSKKDKELHGYGLKSVKHIVHKYDGNFLYLIEDSTFIVKISFFENNI